MRKLVASVLLGVLTISGALGKTVGKEEAMEAARMFLTERGYSGLISMDLVQERQLENGSTAMYVINLTPSGWLLMGADDEIQPVLAYSFQASFDPRAGWNDAAGYLVEGYHRQIETVLEDETGMAHPGWGALKDPAGKKSTAGEYIDPIIEVKWNQGSGWNRFCPEDEEGPGGHAFVGCVAVAMAQAMSVYQHPVQATGTKSYLHDTYGSIGLDFDRQDPYDWASMSKTSSDDYNARLLYHCAVSVEMDFGPDGSGAHVTTAAGAMVRYFSYSRNIDFHDRFADEQEWEDLLVAELLEGRPIIYRGEPGDGTAGHAWNVDGYGDGYFHMNFGWSGANNGYFSLNLIDPGSNDFSENQGAIVGISPPESGPYDMGLSAYEVDEQLPEGSFVAEVIVEDEDPNNVYTYTCYGKWNPMFEDWGPPLFTVENDTLRTTMVFEYDEENPAKNEKFLRLEVEDQYGTAIVREFTIQVTRDDSGSTAMPERVPEALMAYPNPADRVLVIREGYRDTHLELIDISTGKVVLRSVDHGQRLDVSVIRPGAYLLLGLSNNGIVIQRILISR